MLEQTVNRLLYLCGIIPDLLTTLATRGSDNSSFESATCSSPDISITSLGIRSSSDSEQLISRTLEMIHVNNIRKCFTELYLKVMLNTYLQY